MSFEDQLRSDLDGIRVPEALSPPADLADTVLTGMRRQARRRALVAAGGLVIAVVLASATAPAWLSPQPGPGPVAPTDRACGGPPQTRPPTSACEHFDPLTYEIDAGGVTGYQVKTSIASTYYQCLILANPAGDRTVGVILYAAGGEPHYIDSNDQAVPFDPSAGEPAGSVDGAPAYWLPDEHFINPDSNEQGLAWQWAPGAWALVIATENTPGGRDPATPADPTSTVDPVALRTTAAQVAPQLELGVGTPVTSPFSMPVPDRTRLTVSSLSHEPADDGRPPHTTFLLGFGTADKADPTYLHPGHIQPSLLVMADTADAPDDVSRLTKYPEDLGYPAYHNEGLLSVYEVSGFAVNVWPLAIPNADTEPEKASLAASIFRTITIYPGAADSETAWGDPIVP